MRTVWFIAAGVPASLVAGLVDETLWVAGPAWICVALLLALTDAVLCRRPGAFRLMIDLPGILETGRNASGSFRFEGSLPATIDLALQTDERLIVDPVMQRRPGTASFNFELYPRRRGTAVAERLHLRWAGPLGLICRIETRELDHRVIIIPQISRVREEALRFVSRNRQFGATQVHGEAGSADFYALREFQSGDDRRSIGWRQSARHATLLVRQTEAERNRTVVIALDTGRLMSEALADDLPRLDHAIHAALTLAYLCLKVGDRVGLLAFDAKPVLVSGTVGGAEAFNLLQRLAARLDYSVEETNFTLGLSSLSSGVGARSLVVVFTEFADPTGAQLMIETIGRLLKRHSVVFVAFRDVALERLAETPPDTVEDVARAVVAGTLLAEREAVLTRLRRMGVAVIQTEAAATGPALIARYLELKRGARL